MNHYPLPTVFMGGNIISRHEARLDKDHLSGAPLWRLLQFFWIEPRGPEAV